MHIKVIYCIPTFQLSEPFYEHFTNDIYKYAAYTIHNLSVKLH